MSAATDQQVIEWARKAGTPTRMMMTVGMDLLGRPYIPHPWLLHVEAEVLNAINAPGRKIIIVNVPPQEGKTSFAGMALPAWYVGMNPTNQVLFITYNETYSGGWGLKARTILERYGKDLFDVALSKQQVAVTNWKTAGGFGGMISTGILGGITGNPGHLVIIDDVISTMEEAGSATVKNKHWEEWDGTIANRAQEDTTFLITATRYAEDDLSGRIIERSSAPDYDGPPVKVIAIKAIAEPDESEATELGEDGVMRVVDPERGPGDEWHDFLGRRYGETLKGQHSEGHFKERRSTLIKGNNDASWHALFQAEPSARKGGMFPRGNWAYYKVGEKPRFIRRLRVWDLATSEGSGDWTVGSLWGMTADRKFYVEDVFRKRANSKDVEAAVVACAKSDGYGVMIKIEQERAGAGKTVVETYQRLLAGYNVQPAKADGTKEFRADPYSREQLKGNVFLPEGADWVQAWVDEHRQMMGDGRRPRHDDQIDTGAYAMLEMLGMGETEIYVPGMDGDELTGPLNEIVMAGSVNGAIDALVGGFSGQ